MDFKTSLKTLKKNVIQKVKIWIVFELISILSELNKRRTDSECPLDAARCNAV